jgi:hypothetical protein
MQRLVRGYSFIVVIRIQYMLLPGRLMVGALSQPAKT